MTTIDRTTPDHESGQTTHATWCTRHQTDDGADPGHSDFVCRGARHDIGGVWVSLDQVDGVPEIVLEQLDGLSIEDSPRLRATLERLELQVFEDRLQAPTIILKPNALSGYCNDPKFVAAVMGATGQPFEALFEVIA